MRTSDPYSLLNMSEAELARIIGSEMLSGALGAKPVAEEEQEALGFSWFSSKRDQFQALICGNEGVQKYLENPEKRRSVEALSVVADLIVSLVGNVPALVAAAMIMHYGLDHLCKKD